METISISDAVSMRSPRPARPHAVYSADLNGRFRLRSRFISAKLVLAGEERYSGAFGSRSVSPGRFLLSAPGDALHVDIKPGARGYCAFFDWGAVVDMMQRECDAEDEIAPWTMALPVQGSAFAEELQRAARRETALDHDGCCALLAQNLLEIKKSVSRLSRKKRSTNEDLYSRLEVARAFIGENLHRPLTLNAIAAEACLSASHLNRSFARAYGAPPLRYAQNLKLDSAKEDLQRDVCVKDAAERAGFSSLAAFSRAYRRKHGNPPSKEALKPGPSK